MNLGKRKDSRRLRGDAAPRESDKRGIGRTTILRLARGEGGTGARLLRGEFVFLGCGWLGVFFGVFFGTAETSSDKLAHPRELGNYPAGRAKGP